MTAIAPLYTIVVTEVLILFKKDGKTLTLKMNVGSYRREKGGDLFVSCGVHPQEFDYKRRIYVDSRELAKKMLAEVINWKFNLDLERIPREWVSAVEKAITFVCKVPTDPDY
jgi:hypothetical protein